VSDSLLGIKYVLGLRETDEAINEDQSVNSAYDYLFSYECSGYNVKTQQVGDQDIDFFENPNALSIGYMADYSIQNIAAFGNDNVFNSQNLFLSTVVGDTVIDMNDTSDPFKQYTEYFKPLDVNPDDFVLSNVTTEPYVNDQTKYVAAESGDPTVDMYITPETDGDVYMFFQTEYQKSVNLWLSTTQDEDGNYTDYEYVQSYFEDHNYHILNLGSFEPGTTFNLRMTVANEFTIVKNFYFYQLDEDLYQQAMDKLKTQQWNLTEADGNHFVGTIEAEDNQVMLTSIPYEPGWTVKVDGKRVDNLVQEVTQADGTTTLQNAAGTTGQVIVANALMGIRLTAGTHTVEITYTPPGLVIGIFALIAGIILIILIYRYDKKNNKTFIARRKERQQRAQLIREGKKPESESEEKPEEIPEKKAAESKTVEKTAPPAAKPKSKGKKGKKKK
jgi:uncharacterized membrane protein YfhO